jgi:hypothetical protein
MGAKNLPTVAGKAERRLADERFFCNPHHTSKRKAMP